MPLKTIQMLWDGETIWGPVAPQDADTRDAIQERIKPTHWLQLPPAPSSGVESREQEVVRSLRKRGLVSPNARGELPPATDSHKPETL